MLVLFSREKRNENRAATVILSRWLCNYIESESMLLIGFSKDLDIRSDEGRCVDVKSEVERHTWDFLVGIRIPCHYTLANLRSLTYKWEKSNRSWRVSVQFSDTKITFPRRRKIAIRCRNFIAAESERTNGGSTGSCRWNYARIFLGGSNISPAKYLSLPISSPFLYYTILHYIIKDKRFVLFT